MASTTIKCPKILHKRIYASRAFEVVLSEERARELKNDGWNVRIDLDKYFYLVVWANAKNFIPLPEDPSEITIEQCAWQVGNRRGNKVYLTGAE